MIACQTVVSLKESHPITERFMQKQGAEPLRAPSVTQTRNQFSECVMSPASLPLGKTTRWLAGKCTVHVYVCYS